MWGRDDDIDGQRLVEYDQYNIECQYVKDVWVQSSWSIGPTDV